MLLGSPAGSADFVRQALDKQWEDDRIMINRVANMPDVQSSMWAIRILVIPKMVYTMRTVPPQLADEHYRKWDEALSIALSQLLSAEVLHPFARRLLSIKTKHGGGGVPSLCSLSRIAYQSSLVAVTWALGPVLQSFADAVAMSQNLPPITFTDRDSSDINAAMASDSDDPDEWTPSAVTTRVWSTLAGMPKDAITRLLGSPTPSDDAPDEVLHVHPATLRIAALTAKFQREFSTEASAHESGSLTQDTGRRLATPHATGQRASSECRRAAQQHAHGAAS